MIISLNLVYNQFVLLFPYFSFSVRKLSSIIASGTKKGCPKKRHKDSALHRIKQVLQHVILLNFPFNSYHFH